MYHINRDIRYYLSHCEFAGDLRRFSSFVAVFIRRRSVSLTATIILDIRYILYVVTADNFFFIRLRFLVR